LLFGDYDKKQTVDLILRKTSTAELSHATECKIKGDAV